MGNSSSVELFSDQPRQDQDSKRITKEDKLDEYEKETVLKEESMSSREQKRKNLILTS